MCNLDCDTFVKSIMEQAACCDVLWRKENAAVGVEGIETFMVCIFFLTPDFASEQNSIQENVWSWQ